MSTLFSSPGKSASQGASGEMAQLQPIISQIENYTGQQQQAERGAIAGVGENPYFGAAQQMSPAPYRVNPGQTQTFGTSGPGTYLANLSSKSAGGAAPPWNPGGGAAMPPLQVNGPGGGNGGGFKLPPGLIGGGGEFGGYGSGGAKGHTTD